jgi:hypothetical protein
MVAGKTKRTPEERRKLHAALARRPGVTEKIAEATAEYKKAVAAGGLGPPKKQELRNRYIARFELRDITVWRYA